MAKLSARERVRRVASRQRGRIARRQLLDLGVADTVIRGWINQGYLRRKLPGVYAVGHDAPSIESNLAAAVLYGGTGAMLSHATAAWWWSLIDDRPSTIDVSVPRRCRSRRGVRVHGRRELARDWHKGLPVTSVAQTILDFASVASLNRVRNALANAEYHRLLDVDEVGALFGSGHVGSAKLRAALKRHEPRLAYTRSPIECAFLAICEEFGIPVPEVNVRVAGWTADFLWREEGVVVEVDAYGNHHTPAQVDRDHRKDLALRAAGLIVNRYSRDQVDEARGPVAADVIATLARRRAA